MEGRRPRRPHLKFMSTRLTRIELRNTPKARKTKQHIPCNVTFAFPVSFFANFACFVVPKKTPVKEAFSNGIVLAQSRKAAKIFLGGTMSSASEHVTSIRVRHKITPWRQRQRGRPGIPDRPDTQPGACRAAPDILMVTGECTATVLASGEFESGAESPHSKARQGRAN